MKPNTYNPILQGARCDLCPLRGKTVVPPDPLIEGRVIRLVIISDECSSADEKMGHLLSGHSGKIVYSALAGNRLSKADTHVTSATLCHPESEKEAKRAAVCCAPRLLREVAAIPDAPILAMGRWALAALSPFSKLLIARGFVWEVKGDRLSAIRKTAKCGKTMKEATRVSRTLKADIMRWRRKLRGRVFFPTLSAHFAARTDTWAPIMRLDISRACRWVHAGGLRLEDEGTEIVWPGRRTATKEAAKSVGDAPPAIPAIPPPIRPKRQKEIEPKTSDFIPNRRSR